MKKCSKCPFVVDMGTREYPEMACDFFGYHVPEEFDSEDHEGCNLRFCEAMVLEFLLDDDYEPTEEKESRKGETGRNEAIDIAIPEILPYRLRGWQPLFFIAKIWNTSHNTHKPLLGLSVCFGGYFIADVLG